MRFIATLRRVRIEDARVAFEAPDRETAEERAAYYATRPPGTPNMPGFEVLQYQVDDPRAMDYTLVVALRRATREEG